ncbi:MAG TPA: TA system VapC family ribonuclease toxin [Steroidobacter sp.]
MLDVNVLIALAWPNHTEHERVQEWFAKERAKGWATCLVTQLTFIRVSSNATFPYHVSPSVAQRYLSEITSLPDHSFWAEPTYGYAHQAFGRTMPNTSTHLSVTDGYLATLALIHGGRLATLDTQLPRVYDSAVLV